ncbi:MAG: 23S rRNA (adenine(2030)-N(6))-methyltransferase RlmJ [Geminicoccaceae bacterium]
MLSYRHAFHAGGWADVLKHAVFTYCLDYALKKPAPLYVLDTHAGAGVYDLADAMSAKTGEWQTGVGRLMENVTDPPALLRRYLGLLAGATVYPGSPAIAVRLLRPGDRLDLVELHPTDFAALRARFGDLKGARVSREDGLEVMQRRLPPHEQRGLVLIDPSYEIKTEYETVVTALVNAHRRWPNGTYILWYPVIERMRVAAMLAAMVGSGIRRQYRIELLMAADGARRGMTASGVLVVNPPWTLAAEAHDGLPWLVERLGAEAGFTAGWLVTE